MIANLRPGEPEVSEFLREYEKWRQIYSFAGKPPRNEPVWEAERLHLREGYPYPDWRGYILDSSEGLFRVFSVTTERRNDPLESLVASFSNVDDAGKYIIWKVGSYLRIDLGLPSLTQRWASEGLDHRVEVERLAEYESKFELKDDPARYFVIRLGGVQPENRLLPLTYEELDGCLLDGMPNSVLSQL
ncbi:hypothetical protein H7J51_10355 [Mycobacterium crocinum]|uniref:Uncharacterized protein n=1 Tax=Mycolicibacterium crocinum TaxID=388459 RepID=A0ABY3TVE9_9MYCO|nr:hypothetical protein [Mycolicibacterium crocinum]MCV7215685.1 hypothetical protein [Mycolicibacterium crocinum]ULN43100.1 hypothetical protein MI149_08515 [Mycolicibacterium crocinum]